MKRYTCDYCDASFDTVPERARHEGDLHKQWDTQHYSSCQTNNAPALPTGPCDCGGYKVDDYC